MELPNVFKSNSFFMRTGDTLHAIIRDETGTAPIIYLTNPDNPSVPEAGTPLPPVAIAATDYLKTSFLAKWNASTLATGYRLDVSTNNTFSSFVGGYENLDVNNVTQYSVTGLTLGGTYYYRVRAYNTIGTSQSSNFVSVTVGVVTIGTQIWTAANVDVNIGGSRIYNNDAANEAIYGRLYDFSMIAAIEAAHTGFHVPTKAEWETLAAYLGGGSGGSLKEAGTTHWQTPNTGATNSTGFTALPGGYYVASYLGLGTAGRFMTSTTYDASNEYCAFLSYNSDNTQITTHLKTGFLSVRLIKT